MTAASSSTASSSASSSTSQDRHHRNVARGTAPRAAPRSSRRSPRAAAEEERRRSGGGDPARMGDPGQVEELEPYSVLGVSRTDSPRALRRRYQELVRQLHPDRAAQGLGKGEREEQLRRFLEVERAWRTLGDAETRRAHDLRARVVIFTHRTRSTYGRPRARSDILLPMLAMNGNRTAAAGQGPAAGGSHPGQLLH
ncbi:uncharacterized protein LOC144720394 isoform X4 [Lampetra planeri]